MDVSRRLSLGMPLRDNRAAFERSTAEASLGGEFADWPHMGGILCLNS
jgi:hypothetical protein